MSVINADTSWLAQDSLAAGANAAAWMEMDAAALIALVIDFSGRLKEEPVVKQYSAVENTSSCEQGGDVLLEAGGLTPVAAAVAAAGDGIGSMLLTEPAAPYVPIVTL